MENFPPFSPPPPIPVGLGRNVSSSKRGLGLNAWSLRLHCAVSNCLSVRHAFLWPGGISHWPVLCVYLDTSWSLWSSGCVPVTVNEAVDAKNSTEPWLPQGGFTCHSYAVGWFMCWVYLIQCHSPTSRYTTKTSCLNSPPQESVTSRMSGVFGFL